MKQLMILLLLASSWGMFGQVLQRIKPGNSTRDTKPKNEVLVKPGIIRKNMILPVPSFFHTRKQPVKPEDVIALPSHTDAMGVNLTAPIELSEWVKGEDNLELLALTGIMEMVVFPDKNPRSGNFYYFPNSFDLVFDQENGKYGFDINYPQGDRAHEAPVQIKAAFRPDTKQALLELVRNLIAKPGLLLTDVEKRSFYAARIPLPEDKPNLLPVPLAAPPRIDLPLEGLGIATEEVQLNAYSDLSQNFNVSWGMTVEGVESLVTTMSTDYEFRGRIELQPASEGAPVFSIPLQLSLIHPRTIGTYFFNSVGTFRIRGMKNEGKLPLKVESVFVLAPEGSKDVVLNRIQLHGQEIAPGAERKSFSQEVGLALHRVSYSSRVLLTHSIVPCEDCVLKVRESILHPKGTEARKTVLIREYSAFEVSGADEVHLDFDVINESVRLEHGGKSEVEVPVALDGSLSYRFKVILVMPDGTVKRTGFIENNEPRILLNEEFMRTHFIEYRKP